MRKLDLTFTVAALGLAALLTACNGFKRATPKNFTRALNSYFATRDQCLYSSAVRFPYEASLTTKTPTFDALTAARLLDRKEETAIQVKRYSMTPYAEKNVNPRFCYGQRQVVSIVSSGTPVVVAGLQTVHVTYRYKIVNLPGWADSKQMRKAFPALAKATSPDAKDTTLLVLTVNGWQVLQ